MYTEADTEKGNPDLEKETTYQAMLKFLYVAEQVEWEQYHQHPIRFLPQQDEDLSSMAIQMCFLQF